METPRDFFIIFQEMERANSEHPYIVRNIINEMDLIQDQAIKEFAEICSQINQDQYLYGCISFT